MDAAPPGGAGACASTVPGLKLQISAWLTMLGELESQGLLAVSLLSGGAGRACTSGRSRCSPFGSRGLLTPQSLDATNFALPRQNYLIAEVWSS